MSGFSTFLVALVVVAASSSLSAMATDSQAINSILGKRLASNAADDLGKRPRNLYSFGIGKRSISNDELEEFMQENHKRNPYAFGLGKRDSYSPYSYGLTQLGRKRDPYGFGLGKRTPYTFGLGKREDPYYAFGMGKRED